MKFTPNLITTKKDKTFKFYFFTIDEYENKLSFSVENEILLFQDECIEMEGYISDMTEEDENSIYSRMNCSVECVEEIKANNCLIITSFYH